VQNMHILPTDNMPARKTVQLSPNTYNELAKMGDLNSSFDSVIANLIRVAKQHPQSQK
jgi:predicted CopG family antitoxin